MRTPTFLLVSAVTLFSAALSIGACKAPPQPEAPAAAAAPNYAVTATVRDIMAAIIDPAADGVWNSVKTTVSAEGTVNTVPTTDEEWRNVRRAALTLIESTNLMLMPDRKVAWPGEGPAAPGDELHPDEVYALIQKDPRAWRNMTLMLRSAANEVIKAVDAKNANTMLDVGERLEIACETCHTRFWYPNQRFPEGYGTVTSK